MFILSCIDRTAHCRVTTLPQKGLLMVGLGWIVCPLFPLHLATLAHMEVIEAHCYVVDN